MPAPHTYSHNYFDAPPQKLESSLIWIEAPHLTNRFAATQFGLVGGEGGYIGIQQFKDGQPNRAIFSIWGAEPLAPWGKYVHELGVDVAHCSIEYLWEFNKLYKFEVEIVGTFSTRRWIAGWVTDPSGERTLVGLHTVPIAVTALSNWTVYFLELFGETECFGHKRTQIAWFPPLADGNKDLAIHRSHLAACSAGSVREGYLHISGGESNGSGGT